MPCNPADVRSRPATGPWATHAGPGLGNIATVWLVCSDVRSRLQDRVLVSGRGGCGVVPAAVLVPLPNTVIIFTANLGTRDIPKSVGLGFASGNDEGRTTSG